MVDCPTQCFTPNFEDHPSGSDPSRSEDPLEVVFGDRLLIGLGEAAKALDVNACTIRAHVAAGDIVGTVMGVGSDRRHLRFSREQIKSFLRQRTDAPKNRRRTEDGVFDKALVARHLARHRRG